MKTIKYKFHVSTNRVGSDCEDEVELQFDDDATEQEIEDEVEAAYLDWRNNYVDGGWSKIEEPAIGGIEDNA